MFGKTEAIEFDAVFPEWGDVDGEQSETDDERQARLVTWFKRQS